MTDRIENGRLRIDGFYHLDQLCKFILFLRALGNNTDILPPFQFFYLLAGRNGNPSPLRISQKGANFRMFFIPDYYRMITLANVFSPYPLNDADVGTCLIANSWIVRKHIRKGNHTIIV